MDYQNFIGYPLDFVCNKLKEMSIDYTIFENSDEHKKFDTLLVVKIEEQGDGSLKLWTDKFLLYI